MEILAWRESMILTFIDTETTGLDLVDHDVIDFAALQVYWDRESNHFNHILQYTTKIKTDNMALASPQALKMNHYSEGEWITAPYGFEVAATIKQIIDRSLMVVGQNVIFDYRFINKLFDNNNRERPDWGNYFDTKHMADQLVHDKKLKRSSLDYLAEHYKIKNIGRPHTAMCDVLRTFELFKILSQETELVPFDFGAPYDPYKNR
jgi:DNA polymerase III epsilon subunit-like protein